MRCVALLSVQTKWVSVHNIILYPVNLFWQIDHQTFRDFFLVLRHGADSWMRVGEQMVMRKRTTSFYAILIMQANKKWAFSKVALEKRKMHILSQKRPFKNEMLTQKVTFDKQRKEDALTFFFIIHCTATHRAKKGGVEWCQSLFSSFFVHKQGKVGRGICMHLYCEHHARQLNFHAKRKKRSAAFFFFRLRVEEMK